MISLPICLYELLGDSSKKMGTKEAFDKGCGTNELFIDIGKRRECPKRSNKVEPK